MKKITKMGFTLIELLAVIVVLAIIAVIATPTVVKTIDDAKKGSFKNSAQGIIKAAEYDQSRKIVRGEKPSKIIYTYNDGIETSNPSGNKLDLRGIKPKNGIVIIDINGKVALALHDGTYCVEKNYRDTELTVTEKVLEECKISMEYADNSGASIPVLDEGMIPIRWDGSKWIKADITDRWYDYNLKEWANVVLVTEATRNTYINAAPGTTITEADVLAYLVWIPKYKYKLFNVNAITSSPQEIEIIFEDNKISKSNGSTNGTWLTHPAFTFGSEELNGFWVGKFETTGDTTIPTVKPGVESLREQTISTQFEISQKFNSSTTYGISSNLDAHMMKNMEWGAVTYLSHSKYGKNNEIWKNPSSSYITGCSGTSVNTSSSYGCSYHYTTNNGQQASTTGNIYGIYDMNGGAWEYVMGGMYNSDNKTIMIGSSGFNQAIIDGPGMDKYIDKYIYGTTYYDQEAYNRRKLGDATGETRGWYSDYADFVLSSSWSWFNRGGNSGNGAGAGIFSFVSNAGHSNVHFSFRLAVSAK